MENTSTKIGAQIKQLRLAAGMTQRELAQRINVGNTTLSQYESGARVPSDEVKLKIATVFGVSVDYLLGATNSREPISPTHTPPAAARRRPQSLENSVPCLIGNSTGSWGIFRR